MGRTSDANERLMDAARDLIWEESYGAVTIDDICKRAEVQKGSFYHFFESKAPLAVAALERMWAEEWKPHLDSQFSPSIDPVARLTGYLESIYPRAGGRQTQLWQSSRLLGVLRRLGNHHSGN